MKPRRVAMLLVAAQLATSAAVLADTVTVSDRDGLVRALGAARPGTVVLLAPGTYRGGLRLERLEGEAGNPIVIASEDRERPATISGGGSGMHLSDAAHLEIRDLVVDGASGNGINIDDGGSFDSPSHHVVLRRVTVRDVGPDGNRDGIKLSGVVDFRIEDCVVERWGSGGSGIDMVGCHRGVVEGSTLRHEGPPGANGVQMKGGSSDISVRRCRFEHAGGRAINIGGSTGRRYFRPRPQGHEAKDITVEDNVIIGSMAAVAFVGVDGASVRFNTIYRPKRWILRILQETRGADFVPCRNGRFTNNVIAYRSDELATAVNVGDGTSPATFEFASNWWWCIDRPERATGVKDVLPAPEKDGVYGKDPLFRDAEAGDLSLAEGTPVRDAGRRAR